MILIHLDTIDSTNTYAKQKGLSFASDAITCITAEEQTAGRGRFQRSWNSPKGVNLYVTFYFHLPTNAMHLISLGQVMTYTFTEVLLQEGLQPKIKWPNDVLLGGKKLAGVLCETVFHRQFIEIILGIGINVNMEKERLAEIEKPATSLFVETGRKWDKERLLTLLQKQFVLNLEKFKARGFEPFHSPFEHLLAYKGEQIRLFDGQRTWIGRCHSLTVDGQLNLSLEDGSIHTVLSAEITLL